ncbi:hypothetical protein B4U80_05781, partial [Leptotrombidium deliense]
MYSVTDSLEANIKEEQERDDYCKDVKNKILKGADVRNFEIIDGILYRLVRTSTGINYALVIPHIKRQEILRLCHDDPLAGHTGIDRTYYRIRSRAYWPKLFQDVEKYVKTCNDCQTRKRPIRIPPGICEPIVPNEPFMAVGIDFEGPLPVTENGNKYII